MPDRHMQQVPDSIVMLGQPRTTLWHFQYEQRHMYMTGCCSCCTVGKSQLQPVPWFMRKASSIGSSGLCVIGFDALSGVQ